ncbi:MAG TPA: hypothetical protein VK420_13265 [Longimicrobium sp.]|nr:hypothetical protein [Longimicrobium sp.]
MIWGVLLFLVLAVDVVTLSFADLPPPLRMAAWTSLALIVAGLLTVRVIDWRMTIANRRAAFAMLHTESRR